MGLEQCETAVEPKGYALILYFNFGTNCNEVLRPIRQLNSKRCPDKNLTNWPKIWKSKQKHPHSLTQNSTTKRNLLDKIQLKLGPCLLLETLRGVSNQIQGNIYPVILQNLEVRPRLETELHIFSLFFVESFFFFFFFFFYFFFFFFFFFLVFFVWLNWIGWDEMRWNRWHRYMR